ncbi:MAG: hypothetical protein EBE86_013115 [Hormoscilla sp. GUM202]|nr:hypothetical protein [Hormoscilla sp. GUM202]
MANSCMLHKAAPLVPTAKPGTGGGGEVYLPKTRCIRWAVPTTTTVEKRLIQKFLRVLGHFYQFTLSTQGKIGQFDKGWGLLGVERPWRSPSLPRGTAVFAFILTEISLMPCPYRKWRSPDRITFAIAER